MASYMDGVYENSDFDVESIAIMIINALMYILLIVRKLVIIQESQEMQPGSQEIFITIKIMMNLNVIVVHGILIIQFSQIQNILGFIEVQAIILVLQLEYFVQMLVQVPTLHMNHFVQFQFKNDNKIFLVFSYILLKKIIYN